MKSNKQFVRVLLALLVGYLLFNFTVWHLFVNRLFNDRDTVGGDLVRMGYISGSKMVRKMTNDLPRRHLERSDYRGEPVDVLTIGDSFSNGGGGGNNSYYQDYIASINNFTVLNIPQYKAIDSISTISLLLNNGYLNQMKPKFVLISCSEKQCLDQLPDQFSFDKTVSMKELDAHPVVTFGNPPQDGQLMDFFSEANFKFVKNSLLYNFSDHAYGRKVYKARLDRPFFSVENADTLLFFGGDLQYGKRGPEKIARLNDALNTLSDRLAVRGMRLYFMPCVDKYNLYSRYIVNNRHPRSAFFEELAKLPKRYGYVDTKILLQEELAKGEKDVYYADDTHWSWKASEKVFRSVRFR
jgi:hypothetical protein